jgi:hypothetical protein
MSDDDNVIPLPPHGRPPKSQTAEPENAALLPCGWCSTPTDRNTLSTFGARCARCYQAYCREPQPPGLLPSKAAKDADPKAWARLLQAAERDGTALTAVQQSSWREALRHKPSHEEEA